MLALSLTRTGLERRVDVVGLRACVADPNALHRRRLSAQLRGLGAADAVECATDKDLKRAARALRPDLIVADAAWVDAELRAIVRADGLALVVTNTGDLAGALRSTSTKESLRAALQDVLRRR